MRKKFTERVSVKRRGELIELLICWPPERAAQLRARWPAGVIDLDTAAPPNSPATAAERRLFENMCDRLIAKRKGEPASKTAREHGDRLRERYSVRLERVQERR
jgi:hypothetical protein